MLTRCCGFSLRGRAQDVTRDILILIVHSMACHVTSRISPRRNRCKGLMISLHHRRRIKSITHTMVRGRRVRKHERRAPEATNIKTGSIIHLVFTRATLSRRIQRERKDFMDQIHLQRGRQLQTRTRRQ